MMKQSVCTYCNIHAKIKHTRWHNNGTITHKCAECCKPESMCVICNKSNDIRYKYMDENFTMVNLCADCFCNRKNNMNLIYNV